MALLVLSFIAGVLTAAAPCVLPMLPVIIGGAIIDAAKDKPERQWLRPVLIAASLAVSVVVFSLVIKGTTALLGVPQAAWQVLSGVIVLLLGVYFLWPHLWELLALKLGVVNRANAALGKAYQRRGWTGTILIGAALGPVFSSCSPTYALVVATVLPVSFGQGLAYLVVYALGMSATLLLVAYMGQAFVTRLRWLANPNGWFKRIVGVVFILVGLAVIFGLDKDLQAFVLERGWYDPISDFEQRLR
ncbi:MAG TPA: cytochrome c biogenesis protein CcdA [Candidatus Saccharimonadales bacterium]|nr:cytochrome c biogenesis protein CcdA [Candidatus Saccharimonadales bacterium]